MEALTVRSIEQNDHGALKTWWTLHKWPTLPLDYITPNSLIVEAPSGRICAGFLFLTDGPIAWMEFVISNPLCDKLLRDRALDALIAGFVERSTKAGKKVILTSLEHPKLIERYKRLGAIETDKGMTNLAWRL